MRNIILLPLLSPLLACANKIREIQQNKLTGLPRTLERLIKDNLITVNDVTVGWQPVSTKGLL
jgi:hypothetical protein